MRSLRPKMLRSPLQRPPSLLHLLRLRKVRLSRMPPAPSPTVPTSLKLRNRRFSIDYLPILSG